MGGVTVQEKGRFGDVVIEVATVVTAGLGVMLEPHVFVGCMILSTAGAFVGRHLSPVFATKRAFWATAAAGALAAIAMLLLNQWLAVDGGWWPDMPPQLIAIGSGLFGPVAIPIMIKMFPKFAERLLGRFLPDDRSGRD